MGRTCIHKVDQYYVRPGQIKLLGVEEEEEVEKKKDEGDVEEKDEDVVEKAIYVKEVIGAEQSDVEKDVKANF